ncbi:hypothetical protein [Clavibacter capsici]|uniref:Secreted protein n=1 Tax=Clavibacter capsici TaxID=1874630 RepID=A0AAE7CCM5_9MICO|nr:hypothetical protein [Clavibacter capsici]QIS45912.1 hypothetical protein GW570_12895 [Clavibacter capsici]
MPRKLTIIANLAIAMAVTAGAPTAAYASTAASNQNAPHHYVVVTAAMPKNMVDAALRHEVISHPDEASQVSTRWQDYMDRLVVMRIAAQSKIYFKHNLNYTAVRVATQQPDTGRQEYGSTWEYITTFEKIEENGEISDSQQVRTLVDFRNVDGDPQGVVTSYCLGIDGACPSWINETVG